MHGANGYTETMFTMAKLDDFVPVNHPLRPIRFWLNDALKRMDAVFTRMYESDTKGGRPSIAREKLIRALLLQVLYSIRSERMLMEQISYNMLFHWFAGLAMDDYGGCRQELRHSGIRRDVPNQSCDAACCSKRRARRWFGHRWSHDSLGWLCAQSAQTPMHRTGVWLGQDRWPDSAGHVWRARASRAVVPAVLGLLDQAA